MHFLGTLRWQRLLLKFKAMLRLRPPPYNNTKPLSQACLADIGNFSAQVGNITNVVTNALSILDCSNINPVYTSLLYDGFCNGMIDGLYVRFINQPTQLLTNFL